MANHKQALKRHRQSLKRRQRNNFFLSTMRTFHKKAKTAIESGKAEEADKQLKIASSYIHKVAGKGIIHSKKGSRMISRLQKMYNRKFK
ncbi:MAG: 30S ribosomal protein S20 [Myxococcota bacterium]